MQTPNTFPISEIIKNDSILDQYVKPLVDTSTPLDTSSSENSENKQLILEKYLKSHYLFKFDIVRHTLYFKSVKDGNGCFVELTESKLEKIKRDIRATYPLLSTFAERYCSPTIRGELAEQYDPFISYFTSMHEKYSASHHGTIDRLLSAFVFNNPDFAHLYFKKWIVAVVAQSILFGKNELCLVLISSQGSGKTTFVKKLIPKALAQYFSGEIIDFKNKDSLMAIASSFIVLFDELSALTRQDSIHVKSFISKSIMNVRLPYERRMGLITRRSSFIGTSNKDNILTDSTGERRIIPIKIESMNLDFIMQIDDDFLGKLYSEAYDLLQNGFTYWMTKEEQHIFQSYAQDFRALSYEEQAVQNSLTESKEHFMTLSEIKEYIVPLFPDCELKKLSAAVIKMFGNRKSKRINNTKYPINGWHLKPKTDGNDFS